MDPVRLLKALTVPAAYPYAVPAIEVRQTHISIVFLAGPYVYKVKKPVDFGFLDFSTLEKRRHFCAEEVRLNRRLAPDVYLGVAPIVETETGLKVEGSGTPVEWARCSAAAESPVIATVSPKSTWPTSSVSPSWSLNQSARSATPEPKLSASRSPPV